MNKSLLAALAWALLLGAPAAHAEDRVGSEAESAAHAVLLRVDGAISPASADYIVRGIARAEENHAAIVILEIDTPGGLDTAMRDIIKVILGSAVPVVGYVAPAGARAASAGTYILYASHVAAMAPATNLGAATPVPLLESDRSSPAPSASSETPLETADASTRKVVNDAVAYIRALAERRGRNADWAEQAVRDAASISAQQALELGVIDLMAADVPTLLASVDGRTVSTVSGDQVLHTAGIAVRQVDPDWRSRFLAVLANPTVAYILLLLGFGGLLFEGFSPGAIVPGVVGAICLLLALYAFQMLPVNFAGLALIVLGLTLIIAEAFVPAYGALGIGGVVAFVIGSVILMDTSAPGYGMPLPLLIGISVFAALAMAGIIWMALRSRERNVVSGREQMIGSTGEAIADFDRQGQVHVHGERWQAVSNVPLAAGQAVLVTGIDGLTLRVEAIPVASKGES